MALDRARLLMKMGQGVRPRVLMGVLWPGGHSHRGLDRPRQAAIVLERRMTDYDIQPASSAGDRCRRVDFRATDDPAGRPRFQGSLVNPGRRRRPPHALDLALLGGHAVILYSEAVAFDW